MSFKKNTAVTGFTFGMVSASDGSDITTGTPVGYYTLDGGTQTGIGDVTPTHENNGQWSVDLLAAEMNGDIVGLTFTHASAITVHFTIKTDTKIVSDLNDIAATAIVSSGAITTSAGAVSSVTTVATTTTNTDMRGTDSANTTAPDNTSIAAILVDTNDLQTSQGNWLTATGFALSSVATEARLSELDAGTGGKMANQVDLIKTSTDGIDDLAINKNAAFPNFEFLMVLTSDGRTPATGLTVTAQASIDGASFINVSGSIAEVSNGIYQFDALAADTNGDVITWRFSAATADDTFITFKTVA